MEFATFKIALGLLWFGSAFAFGFWQLAQLRRYDKENKASATREREGAES